ncbi:MAG: hypothetical protein A3F83_13635 [Candidatus Glassbacteria bacterium RIFCSPLOWO2_12_FULL_58_11]|uniref:HTH arsR-type domain-containing protein n=2 Tax=Candidatus Glassiibacteriota TaxID=1817805 RepID=A0A1F5YXT7_9BACT|nr:MAG: hypothetical protein A2Z86_10480 [Candidatus Glassbacteria bacterium GWA2_58_10]OGG04702.1 MAG: hypothetical protein A3F83_13635 [Candidatus Glassbacteria bacterium RIFCSPLOWO2_12_FULL_58_11]
MEQQALQFKALGDLTRLRLAALLAVNGETCVCHLARALGEPDYKISRHLTVLRSAGLVEARRQGTWMHYRLSSAQSDFDQRLREFLREALEGLPVVREDLERMLAKCCEVK